MAARKRELIEPHAGDKRFIRRGKEGQFTDKQVDVGRSLAADRRSTAKTKVKAGQGDKGDVKKSPAKTATTKKSTTKTAKKSATKKSATKKSSTKKK